MPNIIEGQLLAENKSFGIVVSRFNEFISGKLLEGAIDCLKRHGVDDESVDVAWVPGSFEVPIVAKRMAASGKYDAVICLGAVVRGATPHFDYIAAEVSKGIATAAISTDVPIAYGIITCDTLEQAVERADTKMGNKGFDAAATAIEMANLLDKLPRK
ncbi:MAG: 6,7-dimethyl-8-ribityllumazine synthase [Candidatus Hydrogenedentes bacterium]|nr:6,7-dimethyl-8-ribityllumazine synthase [Candidatus Hydrogenedentota bacterium]